MIKNVLGAILGAELAKKTTQVDSTTGAATGAIAGTVIPMVLSRMSLPTLIAVGAGGYLFKKYKDKQERKEAVMTPQPETPAAPDLTGVPAAA